MLPTDKQRHRKTYVGDHTTFAISEGNEKNLSPEITEHEIPATHVCSRSTSAWCW